MTTHYEVDGKMIKGGEQVEVRSKAEILATLDKSGTLDGMPFMPQMFDYCGQRFTVYKNAYKTCDTVSGKYIGLHLDDTVHLPIRCDGKAFDGCQAACLLFWRTAWLKPATPSGDASAAPVPFPSRSCTEADVSAGTSREVDGRKLYRCQATCLLEFTRPMAWWDVRQYADAYRSGNWSIAQILRGLTFLGYTYGTRAHRRKIGAPARWLYNKARFLWGGVPFPRRPDLFPQKKTATSNAVLDLKPGEFVRVKSFEDILATLGKDGSHRGLMFDAELVPYCGKVFRVMTRVERFVDEACGEMRSLKTPAVILDGVVCQSKYSGQRMFCPREIYSWWREAWLERVEPMALAQHDDVQRKSAA
ncbi:hypothetical protein [Rhodomicrobium lacus]|uniref:hypothetical protein n=1 Tax=Rhodomicrobium lacus TaxID=2498452 RepID=UPI0026E3C8A7|nr:hypothetical protein [Rhodomicrobium lacus]WKW51614.1 hypothetical protein QMO75_03780 [Rhodomicrobium lacus]